jgi:ABC-type proline/glycine betaine transport system substrate-binding protein
MKIKPIEVFSTQDADNNSKFKYKAVRELEANYKGAIENIEAIKHKLDKGLDIKYIKNFVNIIWEELTNELEL